MYVLILAALVQDTLAAGAVYIALSFIVWVAASASQRLLEKGDSLQEMLDRLPTKEHTQ
jgi:hypothetical protein